MLPDMKNYFTEYNAEKNSSQGSLMFQRIHDI